MRGATSRDDKSLLLQWVPAMCLRLIGLLVATQMGWATEVAALDIQPGNNGAEFRDERGNADIPRISGLCSSIASRY